MTDLRATLSRLYHENIESSDGVPSGVQDTDLDREPTRAEAEAALAVLRRWAIDVTPEEVSTLDPLVSRLIPGQEVSNYPALPAHTPKHLKLMRPIRRRCPTCRTVQAA